MRHPESGGLGRSWPYRGVWGVWQGGGGLLKLAIVLIRTYAFSLVDKLRKHTAMHPTNNDLMAALCQGDITFLEDWKSTGRNLATLTEHGRKRHVISYAVTYAPLVSINWLLQQNPKLDELDIGYTILQECVERPDFNPENLLKPNPDRGDVLSVLIHAGADINQIGIGGGTALHRAVILDDHLCVETLLQAGADKTIKDKEYFGYTAEEQARSQGLVELADFIREFPALTGSSR